MRKTFLTISLVVLLIILVASNSGHNASTVFAQGGTGTPPASAETCTRTLTNLVNLLKYDFQFAPETKPGDADYCAKLEDEANAFAEKQLASTSDNGVKGESLGAFAFLDVAARQYVGTIPKGTTFTAVAHNAVVGSQMIFITGDSFAVFVDFGFTSLRQSDVANLPDISTIDAKPFCSQSWCRNPGPPPTKSK